MAKRQRRERFEEGGWWDVRDQLADLDPKAPQQSNEMQGCKPVAPVTDLDPTYSRRDILRERAFGGKVRLHPGRLKIWNSPCCRKRKGH
jgi:hypothetical protein